MQSKLIKVTSKKLAALLASVFLCSQAVASDTPLAQAFETAEDFSPQGNNRASYKLEDCVFQRTLTNLKFCKIYRRGEAERVKTTTVDLREVEMISVNNVRGSFMLSFELDYGRPSKAFLIMDRLLNGSEGHFDRYIERDKLALEEASLYSGSTFTDCEDKKAQAQKATSTIAFVTDLEPENWMRIVDIAKACREPKSLKFEDRRVSK